jgi:hypothetical protein
MSDNPFEVLQLDPSSAGEAEIIRQAALLRQRATDEAMLTAIRQAVQSLTARPEDRELFGLLTPPGAVHHWPTLERLEAAFRRPPQSKHSEQTAPAPLDLQEVASLLRPLLARELEDMPLPFEPPSMTETPDEILKQTIEGLWQVLPFEPGG